MKLMNPNKIFAVTVMLLLALVCGHVGAQVYKTVDEDGNVVYTDRAPRDDSEPMRLPPLSIVEAPTYEEIARPEADLEDEDQGKELSLRQLRNRYKGFAIISVTYHGGFREPFKNVLKPEVKKDLESRGVTVIAATHALSGVERSIAKKYSGLYPALLIADTLKRFGQGTKVGVEVALTAADAGVLSGEDILAIGGSAKGADTALVLKPANQSHFFDLKIKEIICKPRSF